MELAEVYKRYKLLGPWALEALRSQLSPREDQELGHLLYELELENAHLKQAHPEVRMLWDAQDIRG